MDLITIQQKERIKKKVKKLKSIFRKQVANIFIFQILGSTIFAFGICVTQYSHPISDQNLNHFWNFFISCFYFFAISFSGVITGGHINPAVTIALAIYEKVQRNNLKKLNAKKIICYLTSQLIGSIIGTLLYFAFFQDNPKFYITEPSFKGLVLDFVSQIFGTFIFIFGVLLAYKGCYIKGQPFKYFYIGLVLLVARMFTFRKGCLNPAIALAFQMFAAASTKDFYLFYIVFPIIIGQIIGSMLAVVYFTQFHDPLSRQVQKYK